MDLGVPKNKVSLRMSKIKSQDTKPEKVFKDLLEKINLMDLSYNDKTVFGKPDFVSKKYKLAIFVDGCFWHGCFNHYEIPKTNFEFWFKKLQNNMNRDYMVNLELKKGGYLVLRFWEHEIKQRPNKCLSKVKRYLWYSRFKIFRKILCNHKISNILIEGADQQGKTQLCGELQKNVNNLSYVHNGLPLKNIFRFFTYLKYFAQLFMNRKLIDRSFLSEFLYRPILRNKKVSNLFLFIFKRWMKINKTLLILCCRINFLRDDFVFSKRKELLSFERIQELRLEFVKQCLRFHGNVMLCDPWMNKKLSKNIRSIFDEN
jgi:DNA mismatch endonuclease (patch repair protein)